LQDVANLGIEYTMLLIGTHAMPMADEYSRLYHHLHARQPIR